MACAVCGLALVLVRLLVSRSQGGRKDMTRQGIEEEFGRLSKSLVY